MECIWNVYGMYTGNWYTVYGYRWILIWIIWSFTVIGPAWNTHESMNPLYIPTGVRDGWWLSMQLSRVTSFFFPIDGLPHGFPCRTAADPDIQDVNRRGPSNWPKKYHPNCYGFSLAFSFGVSDVFSLSLFVTKQSSNDGLQKKLIKWSENRLVLSMFCPFLHIFPPRSYPSGCFPRLAGHLSQAAGVGRRPPGFLFVACLDGPFLVGQKTSCVA